jgi:hypothetical protein
LTLFPVIKLYFRALFNYTGKHIKLCLKRQLKDCRIQFERARSVRLIQKLCIPKNMLVLRLLICLKHAMCQKFKTLPYYFVKLVNAFEKCTLLFFCLRCIQYNFEIFSLMICWIWYKLPFYVVIKLYFPLY